MQFLARATQIARFAIAGLRAALSALKAAATFGLSIFTKIARVIISIPFKAAAAGLGLMRSAMKALFAPTIALVNSFKFFTKSILPFLAFGGIAFSIRQAVDEFSTFEATITRATGLLGKFGEEGQKASQSFQKEVRKIAAETLFTSTEVSETLLQLIKGGITDQGQAIAALEPTVDLAIAGNLPAQEAAKAATVIAAQFGIARTEVRRIADALLQASALAPVNVQGLVKAMEQAGAAAKATGITFEETLALVTKITQGLPTPEKAGTGLSRAFARLLVPTGKGKKALQEVLDTANLIDGRGVSLDDLIDANTSKFKDIILLFERFNTAGAGFDKFIEIFDFRSQALINLKDQTEIDAVNEAINQLSRKKNPFSGIRQIFNQLKEAQNLGGGKGLAAAIADEVATRTLFGSLKLLKSAISELKIAILDLFNTRIRGGIIKLRDFFRDLAKQIQFGGPFRDLLTGIIDRFQDLGQAVGPILAKFARLSAIINSLLIVGIGQLAQVIASKLQPHIDGFLASITGLAGLSDKVLESWKGTFDFISQMIKRFPQFVEIATLKVREMFLRLRANIAALLGGGGLESLQDILPEGMTEKFKERLEKMKAFFAAFVSSAKELVLVLGVFIGRTVAAGFRYAFAQIKPDILRFAREVLPKFMAPTLEEVRNAEDEMDLAANNLAESMAKAGAALSEGLGRPFANTIPALVDAVETDRTAADALREKAKQMMDAMRKEFALEGIASAFGEASEGAKDFSKALGRDLGTAIDRLAGRAPTFANAAAALLDTKAVRDRFGDIIPRGADTEAVKFANRLGQIGDIAKSIATRDFLGAGLKLVVPLAGKVRELSRSAVKETVKAGKELEAKQSRVFTLTGFQEFIATGVQIQEQTYHDQSLRKQDVANAFLAAIARNTDARGAQIQGALLDDLAINALGGGIL